MHRIAPRRSSFVGVGLSVVLMAGVVAFAAAPASASPAWSVSPSPNPRGPQSGELNAVSCPTATSCVAVGDTSNPDGSNGFYPPPASDPIARHWNGTTWLVDSVPRPAGAGLVALAGVACTSAANCLAVGFASNLGALAEQWNGSAWSVVPSPNPGGSTDAILVSVSCATATNCFAVGVSHLVDAATSLIEHWDGSAWSIVASPNPVGASRAELRGVSCVSATSCFAVGNSQGGGITTTLVEAWNGTSWSIVPSANRAGATESSLSGVSCASATSCLAVGESSTTNSRDLVEQWNGSSWAVVASGTPAGAEDVFLTGVSCASASSCVITGNSSAGAVRKTVVEHWNGSSAAIASSPSTRGGLSAAACLNPSSCFLVGSSGGRALVEHGNGASFARSDPPGRASQSSLQQVACASTNLCFAVGNTFDGSVVKTLIERWNGTRWSIVNSPNHGVGGNILSAVTCPTAKMCVAVGDTAAGGVLVERWNGKSWSIMPTANAGNLTGVSCPTAKLCVAVGERSSKTLVERWKGKGWAVESSPNRAGPSSNQFAGVTCPSAGVCFAVGSSGSKTLVERWNGKKWSIVASPNLHASALSSVSCVGTNNCFASGTVIERWNGKKWSLANAPATFGTLSGISCTSTTSCVAVGTVVEDPHYYVRHGVIEQWNGATWSLTAVPGPAAGPSFGLNGVTCRAVTGCFAAGDVNTSSGNFTLVDRYR